MKKVSLSKEIIQKVDDVAFYLDGDTGEITAYRDECDIDEYDESTLAEVEQRGWCVDQWDLWQQGWCAVYAQTFIGLYPHLRFGSVFITTKYGDHSPYVEQTFHFFAHDDTYAYDSAGRHELPYLGLFPRSNAGCRMDDHPEDYDDTDIGEGDELYDQAVAHIYRHHDHFFM